MKIKLDLNKEDWASIKDQLKSHENELNWSKINKINLIQIRLGKLVTEIIKKLKPAEAAKFIAYCQYNNYLKITTKDIANIQYKISLKADSYELAQRFFTEQEGIKYIDYAVFTALQAGKSSLAKINYNIIYTKLFIHNNAFDLANKLLEGLSRATFEIVCLQLIHINNVKKLELELAIKKIQLSSDANKDSLISTAKEQAAQAYKQAINEYLEKAPIKAYVQLIAVAYQLSRQEDVFYLRYGGISEQKRSKLSMLIAGTLAILSGLVLLAILLASHGTAIPLFAFLTGAAPKLLLASQIVFSVSAFSLLTELIAPGFNKLFFKNLFYFPWAMANRLYEKPGSRLVKLFNGALGFTAGLLYHPLFMLFNLAGNIIIGLKDNIMLGISVFMGSSQEEKVWQQLLDEESSKFINENKTDGEVCNTALKELAIQAVLPIAETEKKANIFKPLITFDNSKPAFPLISDKVEESFLCKLFKRR